MIKLMQVLAQHPEYTSKSMPEREITAALAEAFEKNKNALALAPDELVDLLGLGTVEYWRDFLQMTPVRNYIKQRMAEEAEIASRKALSSLTKAALNGDVGAVRHLNDLAGNMNKSQANKVVVLHHIPRPEVQK